MNKRNHEFTLQIKSVNYLLLINSQLTNFNNLYFRLNKLLILIIIIIAFPSIFSNINWTHTLILWSLINENSFTRSITFPPADRTSELLLLYCLMKFANMYLNTHIKSLKPVRTLIQKQCQSSSKTDVIKMKDFTARIERGG